MREAAAQKSVSEDKDPYPERKQTYHYAPYRFDSALELDYFRHLLAYLKSMPNVRAYFNGDDTVTGFRIRCYKKNAISACTCRTSWFFEKTMTVRWIAS